MQKNIKRITVLIINFQELSLREKYDCDHTKVSKFKNLQDVSLEHVFMTQIYCVLNNNFSYLIHVILYQYENEYWYWKRTKYSTNKYEILSKLYQGVGKTLSKPCIFNKKFSKIRFLNVKLCSKITFFLLPHIGFWIKNYEKKITKVARNKAHITSKEICKKVGAGSCHLCFQ